MISHGARLRRYRAERVLRRELARRTKVISVVSAKLRAKGLSLPAADLDACYAQAWHGLYTLLCDGESIASPSAWLITVTFRRAIDECRSGERLHVDPGVALGIHGSPEDRSGARPGLDGALERYDPDPDFAAALDRRARLREVFEGLRAKLSEREREAASLCYLQGLSRAQAAAHMGISDARMRKLMEGAGAGSPGVAGKFGELLAAIEAGDWCEHQSSLVRAYAFGILDPAGERHALAVAHCRACPACRAHVAVLRGLASVLPVPLLSRWASLGAARRTRRGRSRSSRGRSALGHRNPLGSLGYRVRLGLGSGDLGAPLGAKLAVLAVVALGGSYAAFGGRAHGSSPQPRHAPARLTRQGSPSRPRALPPQPRALSPRSRRAPARSAAAAPRPLGRSSSSALSSPVPARRARSRTATNPEFAPERTSSAGTPPARPQTSRTAPSPPSPAGGAGEFGVE